MERQTPSTTTEDKLHRVATGCGAAALAFALLILARWLSPDQDLFGVFSGPPQTKPNSAVGFALISIGLLIGSRPITAAWRRFAVVGLGGVVALGAAMTLIEYITNKNLWIDSLVPVTAAAGMVPGRPSAHTAAALLPAGIWVMCLASEHRGVNAVRNTAAIVVAIVIAETAIGYLYGVSNVSALDRRTGMPVTSLILFALMFAGLSAARPESGIVAVLLDRGTGGYMARRVGIGILVVPFMIGLVLAMAARSNLIEGVDNVAISTATTMVVGLLMMAAMAARLTDYDRTRQELTDQLRDLSERDPMTGVHNRRRFDAALADAIDASRRNEEGLALALIDVDKLKQVNDSGGHIAGDRLICGVADVLSDTFRSSDIVARIGGDEFAVILPGVGPEAAERLGEAILATLARSEWKAGEATIHPSVSIGFVVCDVPVEDPDDLTRIADEALYEAKAEGGGSFKLVRDSRTPVEA